LSKTVYIVDYDIPTNPAWRRVYFYKKLRKLRTSHDLTGKLSTQSVLIVQDEELAKAVHALAMEYGKSNIYKAETI